MSTETAELRYYSAREVARLMRLSDGHVLKLIRSGAIRSIRLGQTIRVSAQAIRDFENSASVPVTGNGDAVHTK